MPNHKLSFSGKIYVVVRDRVSIAIFLLWLLLSTLLVAYDQNLFNIQSIPPDKGWSYPIFFLSGVLFIFIFRSRAIHLLQQQKGSNTFLRERQEKLVEQTDFLNLVTNSFPHPFYVIDANTYEIKMANVAFFQYHKIDPNGKLEQHKCYELSHGFDHPCNDKDHPCPLLKVRETGKPLVVHHVHKDGEGKNSVMEINAFPVINKLTGQVEQIIEYTVDITQRIETQRQLLKLNLELQDRKTELEKLNQSLEERIAREVEQNREKDRILAMQARQAAMGETIGNIAHQWRQPLNALSLIVMDLQEAHSHGELSEAYFNESYQKVNGIVQQMSQTIDNFRNFFQSNKEERIFEINSLVKQATALLKPLMEASGIEITLKEGEETYLKANPNELIQCILNILQNASDVLSGMEVSNKKIIVNMLNSSQQWAQIEIINNGPHIEETIRHRIFDPYFSTKPEGKGVGLGLYIAKTLVEQNMGGKLSASNRSEGVCFTIAIPLYWEANAGK